MPDPDAPLPPVSREEALQDYDRYVDSVSIDHLAAELRSIEARASHVDLTEAGGAYAAEQAMRALREGAPFSLVRIGDGEGNLLGALDADFRAARDFSTRLILEMMFGDPDFTAQEIETIRDDMRRAVLSADVLGVSDHVRISRLQTLRQIPRPQRRGAGRPWVSAARSCLARQTGAEISRSGVHRPLPAKRRLKLSDG